jgi:hypothetical protein
LQFASVLSQFAKKRFAACKSEPPNGPQTSTHQHLR